jgi:hypothetical protein
MSASTMATIASMSPVTSSRAPARSAPACSPGPPSTLSTRLPTTTVAIPIGMLMKKTQRQSTRSVMTPPRKSPMEAPAAPMNE